MTHWILIADASDARIFSIGGRNQPLRLVREITNAEGRARTQELVTDMPGRSPSRGAEGTRSGMEPRTTAHDVAAERFVRELAALLHAHLEHGDYTSLSLVAPPHLLGQLREAIHKDVAQQVRSSLSRDLVRVKTADLFPHIESLLEPGIFAK